MSSFNNVQSALFAAVKNFLTEATEISTTGGLVENLPIIPGDCVAWPNRAFDPAGKPLWVGVHYVPNDPVGRTIGQGGFDQISGFLQIDINVVNDTGESLLTSWRDKARIYFHGGRVFSHNSHFVIVTGCGISQGRHVETHFRQSLTISFRSDLKRAQTI